MAKAKSKSARRARTQKHLVHHADGSLWAQGQTRNGVLFGYWEWFRKDGTMLRSGSFGSDGEPTGVWTTCDRKGRPRKVMDLDPPLVKAKRKAAKKKAAKKAKKKAKKTKQSK